MERMRSGEREGEREREKEGEGGRIPLQKKNNKTHKNTQGSLRGKSSSAIMPPQVGQLRSALWAYAFVLLLACLISPQKKRKKRKKMSECFAG